MLGTYYIDCDMETTTQGGYDYEFVDTPPDRVICVICHLPSREPHMTECCGHVFCKSCLDKAKATKYTSCSMCKDKHFNAFCNKQINREVQGLQMYCTSKKKGCEWKGEVKDMRDHIENSDGCQFEEVKCPNECEEMIQRQVLSRHLQLECQHRKVECQYCHDKIKLLIADGTHLEECPKFPLPCPNHCDAVGMILREDMEAHRKECPLEMIQCEYHNVGCEVRMLRKRQREHGEENMEKHLRMTKVELASTKAELVSANNRLDNIEMMVKVLTGSGSADLSSVNFNPTLVASQVRWSIQLSAMEPTTLLEEQTCPAIMKMANFTEFEYNEHLDWYRYFYSHERGYRMQMFLEKHQYFCEIALYVTEGLFDEDLQWPLRARFQVTLLNQISNDEHVSVTLTYDDSTPNNCAVRRYEDDEPDCDPLLCELISKRQLCQVTPTCAYLRNDCIFLKVCKI